MSDKCNGGYGKVSLFISHISDAKTIQSALPKHKDTK